MGLFPDLSKAYDPLNHEILLRKLELYRIRGTALKWIASYLSKRSQMVTVGKKNDRAWSNKSKLTVGIPQGSVIGPLLFTTYVNDITDIKSEDVKCNITTYADDTNMLVTAASITDVVKKANLIMVEAGNWLLKNKLISNSTKSNIMLFKTNRGRTDEPQKVRLGL